MNKHTPGPWFSQYDDNGFYEIGSEAVSLRVAFTYSEYDTDEANARLIAAAPDLLAALQTAKILLEASYLDHEGTPNGQVIFTGLEAAREAIAKAQGEQHE